jgi:hypothetical protein
MVEGELRIGFFRDFKGQDSLLLSGDAAAHKRLLDICESLSSGALDRVRFQDLPFVRVFGVVSLIAERSPESSGLQFASDGQGFIWRLSGEDWKDVALRIAPLLHGGRGHQYFDYLGVQDDVQIIVSTGEYEEQWWQR